MAKNYPVFYVKVLEDGKTGKRVDLTGRVLGFSYKDTDKGPDVLTLQIDNFDQTQTDNPIWDPYKILEITFGYPEQLSPPRQVLIQKRKGLHVIEIEAYDKGMLMHKQKFSWNYENMKRSDVVKRIAMKHGYTNTEFIQDTGEVFPEISRVNKTDAEFIQSLANYEGFTFFVDFDGFHFHEEDYLQPPIVSYTYYTEGAGANEIINIDIENNITAQPGVVLVRGRDPKKKQPTIGIGSDVTTPRAVLGEKKSETSPDLKKLTTLATKVQELVAKLHTESKNGNASDLQKTAKEFTQRIIDLQTGKETTQLPPFIPPLDSRASPQATEESVKKEANKRFRRAQDSTVTVNMTVLGNPALVAKSVITIDGIGKKFSGKYYVKEAVHTLDVANGYVTVLKCKKGGYGGGATGRSSKGTSNSNAGNIFNVIANELTPQEKKPGNQRDIDLQTGKETAYKDTKGRQINIARLISTIGGLIK